MSATRRRPRACSACGLSALGPLRTRAALLAVLVHIDAEIRRSVPHPVPPDVRTHEQLTQHERMHHANQRGAVSYLAGNVVDTDVRGLCYDCIYKRDAAEHDARMAAVDALLAKYDRTATP